MSDIQRAGLATVVVVGVEARADLVDPIEDQVRVVAQARRLHLVRARVDAYGGHVVKSTSDGMVLTFASPRHAVAFAVASQRVLAGSTPLLRFGINTVEVSGPDGEPLGIAADSAARIASRAGGGEVLVSDVVRQLAGAVTALRFVDRGHCRLEGFAEQWHLWTAEDAAGEQRPPSTIGRTAELTAVEELVASTAAGTGGVLLFEGEAGIGKTHLLHAATSRALRSGCQVVDVTPDELVRRPGVVPHAVLAAARPGMPAREGLDRLLNREPDVNGEHEQLGYAVVEATVDLLESMGRAKPVLVAVDDLQWADDLSISTLAAIVHRAGVSRYAVIGALRPTPRPPALDRFIDRIVDGLGIHLRISSLDDVDVHAMASALIGAAPGTTLRERLRATAGNPLFVTELLRSLDEDGRLRVESNVVDVAAGAMPISLRATLVRRLSSLVPATGELLGVASLLGSSFSLHDLATITGRTVLDVAAWLREASLAGLIVGDGDRLAFRHDLVREAVYEQMLPGVRRDLHRAAGHALAAADAPTQQVAAQFARGATPGDREAVAWLQRAATEIRSVSPASALLLLTDAIAITSPDWPERAAIQTEMIEPLVWCGRFDEAEAIATAVIGAPPSPEVEFAALRGLSSVYGNRGDVAKSIATLYRAAAAPGAPDDEACRLRCGAAHMSLLSGVMSVVEAQLVAETTLAEGVATRDVNTSCVALQTLGVIAATTGHAITARHHLSAAVSLLASARVSDASFLIPDTFYAGVLLELDELDEAIVAANEARRRAVEHGKVVLLPMTFVVTATAHFYAGRWDDALAEIEAGMAVINDTGDVNFVLYCDALFAKIAIHRGNLGEARARLEGGAQRLADGATLFGADWLFGTLAEVLAAEGDLHGALQVAEATWAGTATIRYFFGYRSRGVLLVRLAVEAGRVELAEQVTAELEEGARRSPAASAAAAALHSRGLVERTPETIIQAAERYRHAGPRTDLARCCMDAAELLVGAGQPELAITYLLEAGSIHADTGATAEMTAIDEALRALGAPRRPQRAKRPAFGWDALTRMETDVSRLVAEGLTNPEIGGRLFISRRTVETHLSHVFRKLGLTGRTHLVAELTRRENSRNSDREPRRTELR